MRDREETVGRGWVRRGKEIKEKKVRMRMLEGNKEAVSVGDIPSFPSTL